MLRTLLVALLLGPLAAFALDRGAAAPDFDLPSTKGQARLADYRGKVVYVDFWASWCGPCRQSFPWMNEMQARYEGNGLRIVGVNVDKKKEDAERFLQRTPAKFELAFDPSGNVPRAYGVKSMPSSFLVGPDGKVVELHQGFTEEDRADLERKIRTALKLP